MYIFRLRVHVEASMHTLRTFGFTDKDLDEVKGIFADTNLYLLCITVFISSVHVSKNVPHWQRFYA